MRKGRWRSGWREGEVTVGEGGRSKARGGEEA